MYGTQKCYVELAEFTVDDIWQIANAGDHELRRLAHSSRRGTIELDAEDNDGLSQQACTALRNNQPVQVVMHQPRETTLVFPGPCNQTYCRILNMLQLVHDLLWRGRQNRVTVVDRDKKYST